MRIVQTIGNKELWKREKTLFLTSKRAPFSTYERVFKWVDSLDDTDTIVCFNSSELEAEVVKALLVNHIPTVLVVMDGFRDKYNVQIEQALNENRILIMVLKREKSDGKGTTPYLRNQYIMNQVQHTVCGFVNPKGTIILLLDKQNYTTYLIDDKQLLAAETIEKPHRWTVAEDKRLLRMFYEDMGIHAIHKAINRPYSTIYNRIKALTMNDEVLKGREFEDYVLELFDVPNNKKLILKEWRGDKSLSGVYTEGNSGPDFVFEYDGRPFAIECKWRNHMPKDITTELLPRYKQEYFQQYAVDHKMPVFLLLGIGGLPNSPECLYYSNLSTAITTDALIPKGSYLPENILSELMAQLTIEKTKIPEYIRELRKTYPKAYMPWTEQDDNQLITLFRNGISIKEMMSIFQRNRGGITSRLRKLSVV